jgi:C4-dicarboxylate transporter, DctM subunit
MMGAFASVAGLSEDIYKLAHVLVGHRKGGLALATIGGCAGFGALTGSSLATAVTIGRVALPEMRERGYSPDLATGCVAAGGTLGQLVPPSSAIVIYAILVEESIGSLFVAAIVPAIIATVFYMITVSLYIRIAKKSAPATERPSRTEVFAALRQSWGVVVLFGVVIGGIYGGVFTVNEAAAVGAGGAFLFALFRGKLHRDAIWEVMGETTQTTAMVYALIFGAVIFSFFIGTTGLTGIVTNYIGSLDLPAIWIIFLILFVYLLLGAIMDPFALMVITVPIVSPLIIDLGYDLIWFGIIMVVVVETGLITPPFGINVFVLKGVAGDVPMQTIFKGVLPFVAADIIKLILLVLFPSLILWLPSTMIN